MSRKAAPDCAPLHPGYEEAAAVGYCKPPLHTRFKKGQSGNPRGHAKGAKNLASVLLHSERSPDGAERNPGAMS
jgi:hypothetical protein